MATTLSADVVGTETSRSNAAAPRAGFFKRLMSAMIEARERAAEREIERYIATHGGVLTDDLERNISRTFGAPAGQKF